MKMVLLLCMRAMPPGEYERSYKGRWTSPGSSNGCHRKWTSSWRTLAGRAADAGACTEGVWNHYHQQIQLGQRLKFREARMTRHHINLTRNWTKTVNNMSFFSQNSYFGKAYRHPLYTNYIKVWISKRLLIRFTNRLHWF